ncbi:MAG: hypothetical protein ACTSRI_08130, partial [Promethearchaeota archaeon]
MSEEKKEDDFMSLWKKKKKETKEGGASIIGETLDKLEELKNVVVILEKENQELKEKVKENIEFENVIKQVELKFKEKLNDFQNFEIKIKQLENLLREKESEINAKDMKLQELNLIVKPTTTETQTTSHSIKDADSNAKEALIEELQSELLKTKSQVMDQKIQIKELTEENDSLHDQLIEKLKKLTIDYIVPVDSTIKEKTPEPPKPSSITLESLCQDLQTELNRYKRINDELKKENLELMKSVDSTGVISVNSDELKKIRKENEMLKEQLLISEEMVKEKSKNFPQPGLVEELQGTIN